MRTGDVMLGRCLVNAERPNAIQRSMSLLLFTLLALMSGTAARAQDIPPPPYYMSRGDYVVIGVAYDESRVKKFAPAGLQMAPGATGVILMYTAADGYGLPPYSSSWLGLDVEGLDAPGGAKGRWMLAGLYSPGVAGALAKYFNYPTRDGTTRLERNGRRVVAVGTMGGQEMIRAELVLKSEPCTRGPGIVYDVTRKAGTDAIQVMKIPYVGEWCAAESTKVEITAPGNDPFGQLSPVKVLWGGYSFGGFSWSEPVIVR